jgi:cytochrome c-type biogenesis protein CcmH
MIAEGRSDDEIRAYMVERYGDFVLYKPPFNAATAVLWVAPGALVVGGLLGLVFLLRRRREAAKVPAPQLGEKRRREIEALLTSDTDKP